MPVICAATVWVGIEIEIQPFALWIRGGLFKTSRNHENSNFDTSMYFYKLTFNDHVDYGDTSTI